MQLKKEMIYLKVVSGFLIFSLLVGSVRPAKADWWKWVLGGVAAYGLFEAFTHDSRPRQVETDAINGVAAITPVEIDSNGRMVPTNIKRQDINGVVDDVVYDTAFPIDKGAVVVGIVNVAPGRADARLVRVRLDGQEWLKPVAPPPPREDQLEYLSRLIPPSEFDYRNDRLDSRTLSEDGVPSKERRVGKGSFPFFTDSPPYFFAFSTKYMAPSLPHMVELVFRTTGKYRRTVSVTLRFYVVETRVTEMKVPNPGAYPEVSRGVAPKLGLSPVPPQPSQPPAVVQQR